MTRADHGTHTEHDAGRSARADAYLTDERDHDLDDGEHRDPQHAHGPGLICFLCAAAKPFRDALEAAGDERFVCDGCLALYDPGEGCQHSYLLCHQCADRCPDCVAERAEDARAEWQGDGA